MDSFSKQTISDSFAKTGIFPLNRGAITSDLLVGDLPAASSSSTIRTHAPVVVPSLEMIVEEESDENIENITTRSNTVSHETQTDPIKSLPCSQCIVNDITIHPAVSCGAVDLDLASVLIQDGSIPNAERRANSTVKRRTNGKSRWLTCASEIERRRSLAEEREKIVKQKETRKRECEAVKEAKINQHKQKH